MTRSEFIKMCGLLGLGAPMSTLITSCSDNKESINPQEKVLIIGAGAAGLAAGYLLKQQGIEFTILEAAANYGGRMKKLDDFADFPIPLGAEWLHVEKGVLSEIVNDSSIPLNVETTPYDSAVDSALFEGQQISIADAGFTIDQKFIDGTWFDFFETYIVPSIRSNIQYNKIIEAIDYSGEQIKVNSASEEFVADRLILTVPVKLLQNGMITFTPPLPNDKMNAINNVRVWDGCKAFIEFSNQFYPTFVAFETVPETAGQKLFYDAAYGQRTAKNILGLFAVGVEAQVYNQLPADELISYMLNELDGIFNGQASASYVKHVFQNWNNEPFANVAYVYDYEDWSRIETLGKSVDGKLFFAGDAYTTGNDWGSVHAAARAARHAVDALVG